MQKQNIETRRRLLKAIGGIAIVASTSGIAACSDSSDTPSAPATTPPAPDRSTMPEPAPEAAAPAMDESAAESIPEQPSAGELEHLSEDNPQAKALSYVHDASTIDGSKQPRYQPGQVCSNCALYTGDSGAEWGGCSLFPGKAVKATGWCSAYAPKPA